MGKTVTNSDVFKLIEAWAPKNLAYDWDNVGLQIGSHNQPVRKIMVTLDVIESVVDEAIENKVDLIIAHHPLLFKPLNQLNLDTWKGRIIHKLIANNITVYAAHTNLDIADGGVNDMLCEVLGINNKEILKTEGEKFLYKLAVYVPETHLNQVVDALSKEGAGHLGNYSHCTFQTKGTGTFMPLADAEPFIGKQNELEKVKEVKVETIVKESILPNVIDSVIAAHPYEEVAYDVYPLKMDGEKLGIGRIGTINEEMSLDSFVDHVKNSLGLSHVKVSGNLSKRINRVAVLGGSGEKYIYHALRQKADVLITGDMTFHFAQEAIELGLAVIDAGHYIEQIMKTGTQKYLQDKLTNVDIIISETNTDPFQYR
ncbi:Nif3-like dinuclear metal center hexameric protein [Ornithinibacillus halotolerans]|uniref:GTP cyclohydrolase 1 type 2 homolog n=1 Tax=Ornithinibacillus halotolerans TaxID=1274357 RepID=A0A916W5X3_9BACI|nr:Nif3-like dinuclear metal center hexameric protein [Ornithinibacillus halotolerans]GGA68522.1 GTP cyclohydrolase 1 type 2 [Ornithinibacillus halotolerans]